MRNRLTFLAIASCVAPPVAAQVRLIETGIYCSSPRTGEQIDAPDTAAGYISSIVGEPFDVLGRTVPLQQGLSFGIRTQLKSGDSLPVRMVTRHPPMPGADGRVEGSYESTLPAGQAHVRSFTFDYTYEMVPGTWTFEIWDGAALMLSVDFEVVDGPVPRVDRVCTAMPQA